MLLPSSDVRDRGMWWHYWSPESRTIWLEKKINQIHFAMLRYVEEIIKEGEKSGERGVEGEKVGGRER